MDTVARRLLGIATDTKGRPVHGRGNPARTGARECSQKPLAMTRRHRAARRERQGADRFVDGDGAPVELLLLLQQPDGRLKRERRRAAARIGCDHAHTLPQRLHPLLIARCRPAHPTACLSG